MSEFKIEYDVVKKIVIIVEGKPNLQEFYNRMMEDWRDKDNLCYYKFPAFSYGIGGIEMVHGWSVDESQLNLSPVTPIVVQEANIDG